MVGIRSVSSLLIIACFVLGGFASAQNAATSGSPAALRVWFEYSFASGAACAGDTVLVSDRTEGDITFREWNLNGAVNPYGSEKEFRFTMAGTGTYKLTLKAKDRSGAIGEYATSWNSFDCKGSASPSPATQSGAPTATASKENCYTYEWKDEKGNVYRETRCETTSPSAYPTSPPSSGACQGLAEEREKYQADWNYRYYAYYKEMGKEPGSDAAYDERMQQEMENWAVDWKQRWIAAGCDGASDECRSKIEAARSEFEALRSKYEPLWNDYYARLETARKEFSGQGYHTEAEWKEFETKWAGESQSLSSRFEQDAQAIFAKYPGLRECGFYYEYYGSQTTDYKEVYAAPPAADAYSTQRTACEERMMKVKETYASRFEDLYAKLRATAEGSAEYADIKRQLSELETLVHDEMGTIAAECRDEYKQTYDQPSTYKEGAGSLVCYFDESVKEIRCVGRYVGFNGNPDTQVLSSYTCGGQLFFDRIWANKVFEDFQFSETDDESQLAIRSSNLKLIFHDGPRGVINVGVVDEAEVYFVPSSLYRVSIDGNKVVLDGPDSDGVFLGGEKALVWDDVKRVLTVKGEATWVSETCIPTGAKPEKVDDSKYWDSIQKRRLGAQVTIALDGGAVDQKDESYHDGMDVKVQREGAKYVAKVDADENCKTVVLKFDAAIFQTIKLKVVLTDENGNTIEIRKADNLEDILEPCGAGEENAFEYWVVLDELGTQVIVSFAHFSEKRVSVEAAATQDIVVPGFGLDAVILAGAAVLAGAGFLRRRLK